ncbi:hypothetical protein IFO70_36615 [Phormidium tenue FACHB-886]|nr:hypothetical protein [Phormidium tenue FACHB-886]
MPYDRWEASKRSEVGSSTDLSAVADPDVAINLSATKIAGSLKWLVTGLICASILSQVYFRSTNHSAGGLVQLFFVDSENNIPSVYSGFALLFCGILLGIITVAQSQQRQPFVRHWRILSFIFFYLAVDELASIHELAIEPLRGLLKVGGILYYTWVVPAAILLVIFALSYLKFLRALPRKIRRLFIQSGLLYVMGALVTELPEGWVEATYTQKSLLFTFLVTFEEALEMGSIVLFLYTLLLYIRTYIRKPIQLYIN